MVFCKIRQQKGLLIARSKSLELFVKLLSKNSTSAVVGGSLPIYPPAS
jgi:hypothetical protein